MLSEQMTKLGITLPRTYTLASLVSIKVLIIAVFYWTLIF